MFCGFHKLGKATRENRSAGLHCLVMHYNVHLPRKYHRYLNVSGVTTLYSTLYNHHLVYYNNEKLRKIIACPLQITSDQMECVYYTVITIFKVQKVSEKN